MKKFLGLASVVLVSYLHAVTFDTQSLKTSFEGYKTKDMVNVEGSFKNVKYQFGKNTKSLSGILKGATATIMPSKVDMGDETITNNIANVFFRTLNQKGNIVVSFKDVVEGENKGVITAKITIGGEATIIPLSYTINGDMFEAVGQLDLHAFKNGKHALAALSKAAPGHGNMSWPLVNVKFEGKIQQ